MIKIRYWENLIRIIRGLSSSLDPGSRQPSKSNLEALNPQTILASVLSARSTLVVTELGRSPAWAKLGVAPLNGMKRAPLKGIYKGTIRV